MYGACMGTCMGHAWIHVLGMRGVMYEACIGACHERVIQLN